MSLRFIHLIVGVAGLIAFAASGLYMVWVHAGLQGMPDGPRLFFRSAHIYLLWGALLNLSLGCYLVRLERGVLRQVQSFGSAVAALGARARSAQPDRTQTQAQLVGQQVVGRHWNCTLG